MDAQADEAEQRRLTADALGRAAMFKTALAEYHLSNGRWPANAREAGLGAPETFAGGAVSAIDVGAGGVAVVTRDGMLVDGATIRLTPRAHPQSALIDWRCRIDGGDTLRRYLPACRG